MTDTSLMNSRLLCSQKTSAAAGSLWNGLQQTFKNPGDCATDDAGRTVSETFLPTHLSQLLIFAKRRFIMMHSVTLTQDVHLSILLEREKETALEDRKSGEWKQR